MTANTHIHREAWLHAVAAELAEPFKRLGHPIPAKVRLACGFPSVRGIAAKNQRIGECWSDTRSADGHHEIMVSPVIADSMRVAGILAHELVHAAVGVKHGHKGPFRTMAKALGLEGKMTATTEGEAFKRLVAPILEAVGPYPHAELHAMSNGRKKQVARLIKCECAACGYTVRTARQWLDDMGAPHCPEHGEMLVAQ
jgi:SprT-like family